MRLLRLTIAAISLVVLAVSAPATVKAQDTCTANSYCNCPCNQLCYGLQNCSCEAQYCETQTLCGSQIPQENCNNYISQPAPYPSYCADSPSRCITLTTNCVLRQDTYTCPSYVNPCINICGETTPTPTPTPLPLCGNNRCTDAGENCLTCWQDCGACPTATPTPPPPPVTCGNGSCGAGEDCSNCSADCGTCSAPTPPATCGNGTCGAGEDCSNCSADCGTCPAPSCNPNLWGAWGSCSGSPASKSRTNACGTVETAYCYGTITSRAVVVSASNTLCSTVRASTNGIAGAVHQFTAGSASQPSPQTQSGASYVTFANIVGGTYTLSPTVPASYVLANTCWSKSTGSSGAGLTQSLSVPTDGETLTWDLGYRLGTPWVQTAGGNVYAAGDLRSSIPAGTSPRSFILDGTGGSPGAAIYGTSYDFNADPILKGESFVSSADWLAQEAESQTTKTNWYEYFWRKLGGMTTPDSFSDLAAVAKPASRATPYYVVGDMTTSGDWVVGEGETIIFIINGNLTLGGKVNIIGSGFAAFIVNGNITVSSSVGGLYTSSSPVIEGIYITSPTGTLKTGTSSVPGAERFVGQGMFMAGNFLLQRDLDSVGANTTTPAELFLYNPRLLFTMPDSMRDVPITWEEVAP